MHIEPTELPEVLLIQPDVFGDKRGYFFESFQQERYAEAGINIPFVQDNESRSHKGVLRGLHYQKNHPQGKLVRVIIGEVYDVAVDIRRGSPNFGRWSGIILSSEQKNQLWIPPGFAHGFLVLSDDAIFAYKTTDYYNRDDERGILWNDPSIGIDWPLNRVDEPLLSEKDKKLPLLSNADLA